MEEQLIIFAISFAMLGMGVATSLMSVRKHQQSEASSGRSLGWMAAALGLSYILVLFLVTQTNDNFNLALESAIDEGGRQLLVHTIRATLFSKMTVVGVLLFIPYFVFGIFISLLFREIPIEEYHRYYAADLIGAAAGCLLAVLSLDYLGYGGCVAVILASTFIGGTAFGVGRSRTAIFANGAGLLLAIAIVSIPDGVARIEPTPSNGMLSRNFDRSHEVTVGWHIWNAHSRISHLTLTDPSSGKSRAVYAHESGNGWASVPSFASEEKASLSSLSAMFSPQRVLVLFAGVGADMVSIDAACGGSCEISGVEINRHMVENALSDGSPELKAFLARPNITLHVAEAREFLERDSSKYDTILLSWWGAGASHYVGTSGKLAQYMYTKEAFEALLAHLTPDGILVLYNGSKAQTIATFAEIFREHGMGKLDGHVVVMRARSESKNAPDFIGFYDVLEEMRMVVKPSGFDADDLAIVSATATAAGNELILYPGEVQPTYSVYGELANGGNLESINVGLRQDFGIEISVVTDDRPFINELLPRSNYLNYAKLFSDDHSNPLWSITRGFFRFTLLLSVVSIILILGPLFFRSGPRRSGENVVRLFYFGAIGAGFMMLEIGLIRKLGLLLGHPSYSISIVLASLILSTGIGALASQRLFVSGALTEKRTAAMIVAYVATFVVAYPIFVSDMIALSIGVKATLTVAILFPLGFLMGQLFPQGLVRAGRDDVRLVPWAWAINGTSSTIASGVAFLLSYPLGFDMILYLGAAIYGVILVLPLGRATPAVLLPS